MNQINDIHTHTHTQYILIYTIVFPISMKMIIFKETKYKGCNKKKKLKIKF